MDGGLQVDVGNGTDAPCEYHNPNIFDSPFKIHALTSSSSSDKMRACSALVPSRLANAPAPRIDTPLKLLGGGCKVLGRPCTEEEGPGAMRTASQITDEDGLLFESANPASPVVSGAICCEGWNMVQDSGTPGTGVNNNQTRRRRSLHSSSVASLPCGGLGSWPATLPMVVCSYIVSDKPKACRVDSRVRLHCRPLQEPGSSPRTAAA